MLREFCELIEYFGSSQPWVIIAEDLHWSDYATIDFLSRFARRGQRACVLVLATYRSEDAAAGHHPVRAIAQELVLHGYCRALALGSLSMPEIAQYLALRFPKMPMGEDFASLVFQRTGGNPLFVVSLIDDFVSLQGGAAGYSSRAGENTALPDGMPRGLREVIAHQIDRLSAKKQRLLEAASAAGNEFPAAIIADALDREISEVEQGCEELARSGRILISAGISEWPDGTVAGRYGFKHAVLQEAVYERLGPAQRIRLHRKLGERLEEGYSGRTTEVAAVLALHFEKGRAFAKAVRYLGEAAGNAAKRFGNYEAAGYLTRA
jgi:predicted ATPase